MSPSECIAKEYAIKAHNDANCTYGDLPYSEHLQMVVDIGKQFSYLICEEDIDDVIAALWGHDLIEDTKLSYDDVKKVLGERVADIIYAVTNELGKNRKERAMKTYPKIREYGKIAVFVKCCDRLANARASRKNNRSMYKMYCGEFDNFKYQLYSAEHDLWRLWNALIKEMIGGVYEPD